jgi:hypothetical protein
VRGNTSAQAERRGRGRANRGASHPDPSGQRAHASAEHSSRRWSASTAFGTARLTHFLTLNLTVIVVGLALAAALARANPTATTVSVVSGDTTATLSYQHNPDSALAPYSKLRLTISSEGRRAYSHPVDAVLCGSNCWPATGLAGSPVLRVADIERDGSPDVILDLYSGGAHCCFITQVYRYDAAVGTFAVSQRDFADAGASLRTLAGAPVFVSADDRFAYAFAPFAFSGLPIQIWSFARGRFSDVTRRYPAQIAAGAAQEYRGFVSERQQRFGLGFLAAWAADEDLLGRAGRVARTLAAQNRAGELRSADTSWKSGSAFIAQLQLFLARTGYRR